MAIVVTSAIATTAAAAALGVALAEFTAGVSVAHLGRLFHGFYPVGEAALTAS
ncbi:MAG: hypothetical protein KC431_31330 [Myxococcales bacterium]|nr:hypothetical protein [Myxococcales bacterium]